MDVAKLVLVISHEAEADMPYKVELRNANSSLTTAEGKSLSQALYNLANWIEVNSEA